MDLPSQEEREEIFRIHIKKRKRNPENYDLASLMGPTEGWSGAEIEQAIVGAMFDAFSADRKVGEAPPEFSTQDLLENIVNTQPLSKTKAQELESMREWAKDRARMASEVQKSRTQLVMGKRGRNVDRKTLS